MERKIRRQRNREKGKRTYMYSSILVLFVLFLSSSPPCFLSSFSFPFDRSIATVGVIGSFSPTRENPTQLLFVITIYVFEEASISVSSSMIIVEWNYRTVPVSRETKRTELPLGSEFNTKKEKTKKTRAIMILRNGTISSNSDIYVDGLT